MNTRIFTARIVWRDIIVEISYQPDWSPSCACDGFDIAHLQVRSVAPERAALPFTETGYRSHFCSSAEITEGGGPVTFVREWLDAASKSTEWQQQEEASRQYAMF